MTRSLATRAPVDRAAIVRADDGEQRSPGDGAVTLQWLRVVSLRASVVRRQFLFASVLFSRVIFFFFLLSFLSVLFLS